MDWTLVIDSPGWKRTGHRVVIFKDKMWLLGGEVSQNSIKNDVWNSADGKNWTQVTASAPWQIRCYHTAVVYNNRIWIMGGRSGVTCYGDAWYSADGINWTEATASAGWAARACHTSVVYDNKIWVLGGGNAGGDRFSDVWYYQEATEINEEILPDLLTSTAFTVSSSNHSSSIRITYTLSTPALTKLSVYNGMGRKTYVLPEERQQAGKYEISWNSRNDEIANVPAGIYFVRLTVDDYRLVEKVVVK